MKQKRHFTVSEAAAEFGRTGNAIRYWIERGWLMANCCENSRGRKSGIRIPASEVRRMRKVFRAGFPPSYRGSRDPAPRRYLCERCGGKGKQQAGCWNQESGKYDAPAGVCTTCGGEGLLGTIK